VADNHNSVGITYNPHDGTRFILMRNSDNITQLKQPNIKQQVLFTKLFEHCEALTLKHVKSILQKMFDHADDTLFSLAEKTDSTTDSTAYFDSMRIIRLKRSEIESQHFEYIKQAFLNIKEQASSSTAKNKSDSITLDNLSMDDLSLVEDCDLEENIAIKNIVSKVSHHCAQGLSAIEKRLSHILNTEVTSENNPLGPDVISHTFMRAATTLDIELKISLIILKLFDHEIIAGMSPLLHEANTLFIDANILPQFKHNIRKSEHVSAPANKNNEDNPPIAGEFNSVQMPINTNAPQGTSLEHFHQLLSQQQSYGNAASVGQYSAQTTIPAGSPPPPSNVHALNPSAPAIQAGANISSEGSLSEMQSTVSYAVSTPQFIGSLTQLQNIPATVLKENISVTTNESGEDIEEVTLQPIGNLKQFVIQQLQQQDENFSIQQMNPVDQDVIDIVSMLFDFILEDKSIPDSAKAHIARLQIPLLKAAIIDKNFFSATKNTARLLLNTLAHAALGIVNQDDISSQNLLSEIERIVNTINNEFDDDLNIFEQQINLFNKFLEQHNNKEQSINHKIEKKIKQKEDNALAYQWVEDTVDEILADKHLPEAIVELVRGPWKRVMLNTYLNNGQNNDTWKNQVRFIDVLEWSIQPKHESLARQKLANIIGQLVMTLRNGLQVIQVSEQEIENILIKMEPFHFASIKGLSMKEYLSTLTPHEAFLFNSTEEDETVLSDPSNQADEVLMNQETLYPSKDIAVEETNYEADENYQTDLSLDEIDQTILKMEQELDDLEELAQAIETETETESSSMEQTESNQQIDEAPTTKDIFDEMEDDFTLLGDNQLASDESAFNKIITEDIILSGFSTEQDGTPEDQPQDEYLELARHLEQGNWVEFLDENNNKTRAKLAWKSELLGEYTFLNWKFDVIADKTLYGLAADLRRGSATIINDVPLVDRALAAVMSSLTPTGTSN